MVKKFINISMKFLFDYLPNIDKNDLIFDSFFENLNSSQIDLDLENNNNTFFSV